MAAKIRNAEDLPFSIPCANAACDHRILKPRDWFEGNRELTCPRCGQNFVLKNADAQALLAEHGKTVHDLAVRIQRGTERGA